MNINELKALLSRFGIKPNKRLGQNFLLSEKVLDDIVEASELSLQDTVLEIGPGLGVLTAQLSDQVKKVISIEKDKKIHKALHKLFSKKNNIRLVNDDALFFNPSAFDLHDREYKLVANIPYYITSKLLQNFLTSSAKPSLIVLLVQKEVAERIVSKKESLLSLSVKFYADAEIVSTVLKKDFYPVPEVDSAVLKLRPLEKPRIKVEEKKFFQLLKIGFSSKRKQLHNNLKNGFGGQLDVKSILIQSGIGDNARAEDISLSGWKQLYDNIFDR